jgi:hypothetical protein
MAVAAKSNELKFRLKMNEAQLDMTSPLKTEKNTITKAGHTVMYAGLFGTMCVIEPVLAKHKMGHSVFFEGRNLVYRVYDLETEEVFDSSVELPLDAMTGSNVWQEFGKATTYLRRYLAQAVWQLVPEDDDAVGAPKTTPPARKTPETDAKQKAATGSLEDIL